MDVIGKIMKTPILFLIFNRPNATKKVFEQISKVKPAQLFIAADGARIDKIGEFERCEETRNLVLQNITWPCEIKTLFRENNLGCGLAVSQAISWFFEHVEQGIILEDDCLPDISFFNYCEILLEKYKHNVNLGMISGDNFRLGQLPINESYAFSKYPHIWGWATWRRAWALYDYEMKDLVEDCDYDFIKNYFHNQEEVTYWTKIFNVNNISQWNTWDYQWYYTCWKNNMLSIEPAVNLIRNIGFGEDATHTLMVADQLKFGNQLSHSLEIVFHPPIVKCDEIGDDLTFQNRYINSDIIKEDKPRNDNMIEQVLLRIKNKIFPNKSFKIKQRILVFLGGITSAILYIKIKLRFIKLPKNENGKVNIHLGCGDINWPTFINIDARPHKHIHYLSKVDKLPFLKDNSVDLIYVSHCLEHISHLKVLDVLKEWNRILKIGGLLRISVPDFDFIIDIYNKNKSDMKSIIQPLMGGQDYSYNFHYIMFNEKYLYELLAESNFTDIRKWKHGQDEYALMPDWSGREILYKNNLFPISLNMEATKNNK